jgi:integrase
MARTSRSFRVGQVQVYLRGRIWYLCYYENGKRHRPRVGPDREAACQLAAQTNSQLAIGAPAVLSFEPIAIPELRDRWLRHHEQVLRSAVPTINRYRTATDHLLDFVREVHPVRLASQFRAQHAEEFVRYLRTIRVSPNGHPHTPKRSLLDKGIKYILEACRAMFGYALKRRHLSPYAENPLSALQIDRIPVEDARPIALFTPEQERSFLEACDRWQFPLFLTLLLTGLRPGELAHLLLPDDVDLRAGLLFVRNKPRLGWQVKTRSEREVPLATVLVEVLRPLIGDRTTGPVFLLRRFAGGSQPSLANAPVPLLERELSRRIAEGERESGRDLSRSERLAVARGLWRDLGAIGPDRIRLEFVRTTGRIGLPGTTAPKQLRHQFATCLQEARVDPLIRNELMGHSPSTKGSGLGMTAVYTHTRPEVRREQLELALGRGPAIEVAQRWLLRGAGARQGSSTFSGD